MTLSFNKMHLKMWSALCGPFCSDITMFRWCTAIWYWVIYGSPSHCIKTINTLNVTHVTPIDLWPIKMYSCHGYGNLFTWVDYSTQSRSGANWSWCFIKHNNYNTILAFSCPPGGRGEGKGVSSDNWGLKYQEQGAVSIRKTVLPGMAIPMLKIRRPNGRLIFNMEIAIRR